MRLTCLTPYANKRWAWASNTKKKGLVVVTFDGRRTIRGIHYSDVCINLLCDPDCPHLGNKLLLVSSTYNHRLNDLYKQNKSKP